jgi:putative transposase
MERRITFTPGEYYHVYNRGVDKRKIFFSDGDWQYFQRLLRLRNNTGGHIRPDRCKNMLLSEIEVGEPVVDIQAYSFMPNHFHILLSERQEGGVSTFMQRLLTSYSMYMNKKYNRTGPLMCRPFRAKHVDSDEYMRWLISYIHLNPLSVKVPAWEEEGISNIEQAKAFIREYQYSSYRDYFAGERDEGVIINKQSLPIFITELEDITNMIKIYQDSPVV